MRSYLKSSSREVRQGPRSADSVMIVRSTDGKELWWAIEEERERSRRRRFVSNATSDCNFAEFSQEAVVQRPYLEGAEKGARMCCVCCV